MWKLVVAANKTHVCYKVIQSIHPGIYNVLVICMFHVNKVGYI